MDDMDVDQVVEVLDTPDRLASQNINGIDCVSEISGNGWGNKNRRTTRIRRMVIPPQNINSIDGASDVPDYGWRNKNEQATRTKSRSMFLSPCSGSNKSELQGNIRKIASRTTPPSRSAFNPKGNAVDDTFIHSGENNNQSKYMGKRQVNFSSKFQMPACQGHNNVIDLTKDDDHSNVCQNYVAGSSKGEHIKETVDKSHPPLLNANDSDIGKLYEKPRTSHRTVKFVKNGCISPLKIAKAKQPAQKQNNAFLHSQQDDCGTSRELMGNDKDSRRRKGKEIVTDDTLSEEFDEKRKPFSGRTLGGESNGVSPANKEACVRLEEASGWISTRKRTRLNPSLSYEEEYCLRKDDPCNMTRLPRNVVVRRDNEDGSNARNHLVSSQNVSATPISQTLSRKSQGCLLNEHRGSLNTDAKRQKRHSSGTHHCGSSSSAIGNSELSGFESSGKPSNVRSVRTQRTASSFYRISDIDDLSPERSNGTHNIDCSRNRESDVRVEQFEEDEMLALELQEQLYNESNVAADREIDEQIALELQRRRFQPTFTSGSHHEPNPTSSFVSSLHRENQAQSSQNSSTHRVTQTRVPVATRMPRPRHRFPEEPGTVSSRPRNSLYPPTMDVGMRRVHILEASASVNNIGLASSLLQFQRDFNENDYEMLLALDENNYQHCGASAAQINGLPESTVQTDNLEECSVCLEIPGIGDTMRHLPCLHRFHKNCIDEWLRRRKSCPICKSSIT